MNLTLAAEPAWWSDPATRIIDPAPTADHSTAANYAPANLGQLKKVAKQARAHLDATLPGGAGPGVSTLVAGFSTTNPAENYAPINLGQLKAVAKPFYERLREPAINYDTRANLLARGYPATWNLATPWNPATAAAENYAPANLGQLKMAFSFDLAAPTTAIAQNQNLTLDQDTALDLRLTATNAYLPGLAYTIATPPAHGTLTGPPPDLTYRPFAHYRGPDSFTFRVTKGTATSTATIGLTIRPVNQAPLVDAGPNQKVTLSPPDNSTTPPTPPPPVTAALTATITDLDSTAFTFTWSLDEGPAGVTFSAPTTAATSAQFRQPGLYTLRIRVSDGLATRSDTVLVQVDAAPSQLQVTLVTPGTTFASPAAIPLTATVTGGPPARVDFYEGSRLIGQDLTAPYSITWHRSQYGAYRLTALATDAAGNTAVSAPQLVRLTGPANSLGSGLGSTNGPGNQGNSNSGGDGGAPTGGSGGGSDSATGGADPNGGGGDGQDPNGDEDGDGAKNSEDAYPVDKRRREDIAPLSYAILDLGKDVIPTDKEVDQIALGEDGGVAYSWWDGDATYKVAKWKNGNLESGSPKETGSEYKIGIPPDQYTVKGNDLRANLTAALIPNGTVLRHNAYASKVIWNYGEKTTTELKDFSTYVIFMSIPWFFSWRMDMRFPLPRPKKPDYGSEITRDTKRSTTDSIPD